MGLIKELGVALGFQNNKVWTLVSQDDLNFKIQGQFQVENLTENVGTQLPETTPLGREQPIIQFQSGSTETISYRARIFRSSPVAGAAFDALANPVGTGFNVLTGEAGPIVSNGSVRDEIEKIKNAARKDDLLGRPHRFIWTYGTELSFYVFVKSVGGIAYDDIRSDGTIRGASFNIELVKITPKNQAAKAGVSLAGILKTAAGVLGTIAGGAASLGVFDRAKKINIPGGSLHNVSKFIKTKQGDTFESIALKEYGNPLLGDVLRRAQPDKVNFAEGDELAIVARQEIVQIEVTPQSIALRDRPENAILLSAYTTLRGKPAALVC